MYELEGLGGQETEPQEQRHGLRFAEVFRQPAGGLEICFLDHVRRIDPPLEPSAQAQGDHPPQPAPMLGQGRFQRGEVVPRRREPANHCRRINLIVRPVIVSHKIVDCALRAGSGQTDSVFSPGFKCAVNIRFTGHLRCRVIASGVQHGI